MKGKWRDREFEIDKVGTCDGYLYDLSEVELLGNFDYWEKLKHQYAGMAMQGILSNSELFKATAKNAEEFGLEVRQALAIDAKVYATALVEKLKNEQL